MGKEIITGIVIGTSLLAYNFYSPTTTTTTTRNHQQQLQNKSFSSTSSNLMVGRVAIITGGNRGIGKMTALGLAQNGCHVIIGSRCLKDGLNTCKWIKNKIKRDDIKVEAIQLDLSSRKSMNQFVHDFHHLHLPLHVLINNAGTMCKEKKIITITDDDNDENNDNDNISNNNNNNVELTFATNFLGPFYLTNLLLPDLIQSSSLSSLSSSSENPSSLRSNDLEGKAVNVEIETTDEKKENKTNNNNDDNNNSISTFSRSSSRIINVSSSLERNGDFNILHDLCYTGTITNNNNNKEKIGNGDASSESESEYEYEMWKGYANSKLCLTASTYILSEKLQLALDGGHIPGRVNVTAVSPGVVNTDLGRWASPLTRFLAWPLKRMFMRTSQQGAEPILYAAISEEMETITGVYLNKDHKIVQSSELSHDDGFQRSLIENKVVKPILFDLIFPSSTKD